MSITIGQTLNHYRVLRPLGAGGMGEVYEAEDTRLGRKVALKVLPEEMARDPQRRERFEREARAVAALSHPSIVTIYSVEEAGGVSFITMELVEGQMLRQVLPRGGLPLGKLLELAIPISEAVAAAHQRGITHRDLKPENVLVSRDGMVKVLDFGLAKVSEGLGEAGGMTRLPTRSITGEGRIVGTVAYMSPEQAEGKPVDPRSDVFALGIILYEMSTGERPFKGDTPVSLLSSILKDSPPPVTQINRTLPRDLARIVDRCLAKDPARRFQSAMGLATELATLKKDSDSGDLEAVGAGGPIGGVPRATVPGRTKTFAYAAAAVVAGLAVAGYVALRAWRVEPPAVAGVGSDGGRQRIVVLPFENLGVAEDAYFAAGMTEEITSRLASMSGLGVISRTSAVQYAKTGKTTRQIGQELGVDYVLEGSVRWDRGAGRSSRVRVTPELIRVADDTHLWADRYDREMKDIFAVQSEIAEQVVQKLGVAVPRPGRQAIDAQPTENLDAYQIYLRGKDYLDASSESWEGPGKAVETLGKAVELDPGFALAWAALSKAHSAMYHFRRDYTEERLAKARECADKALSLNRDLREGHLALGYYYYWGRLDYEQALQEFSLAAGGREGDAEILEAVGYIRRRQGHWDDAIANLEKAFSLNPRNSSLAGQLAGAYGTLRRYAEAIRFMDIAISLSPDADLLYLEKSIYQVAADGNTRAARETLRRAAQHDAPELRWQEVYFDILDGRYREALDRLRRIPSNVLETPVAYLPKPLLVGLTYLASDDGARAREACESARQVLAKEVVTRPRDPRVRSALGIALGCLGRKEEAVREARLAVDISPISRDALDGPEFLLGLARVYTMVGESDAAFDLLDRLLSMPSDTCVSFLKLDPVWAPLRKSPRFQKLMEKYG